MAIDPIRITGLREFQANLKKISKDLPKVLRIALNVAGNLIADEARPRVARVTGKAASTVKARSTARAMRVVGGGNRAPWYPWLDFGGRAGRNKKIRRAFLAEGRYIYAAYSDRQPDVVEALEHSLLEVVAQAGIQVD